MCSVCAVSFSSLRERASPRRVTRLVMMFVASPPRMTPMLAVVSSSMRPSFIAAMASAAILMAEMPYSGATPACDSRPWTRNSKWFAEGPFVKRKPGSSESKTRP